MANTLTWVAKSTGTAKPGIAAGKKMTGAEMEELRLEVNNRAAEINGKRAKKTGSTETVDFTPSALVDGAYITVDSATDVTVTFDSGAIAEDLAVVNFEQKGTGRILFANGTATITAAPSLSLVSGGVGSIQSVIRKAAAEYTLTGVTE
jgi:hypothetical protein